MMVDIIMLTYKHESFIEEAIKGVLEQQTNFKFRLLIFDDCSPDKTEQIVAKFMDNSNENLNIHYFKNHINIGASSNGLLALKAAKSKYIALCEGDDYWTDPFKLQKQVDLMEKNPKASIVFSNIGILHQSTSSVKTSNYSYPSNFEFDSYLKNYGPIPTCTMLIRNGLIEFDDKTINLLSNCPVGDFPFRFLLGDKGFFLFISDITAVYRKHNEGVSNNFNNSNFQLGLLSMYKSLNKFFNFKYNNFLGAHHQGIFEKLFYCYCVEKKIFRCIIFFFKSNIDYNRNYIGFKRSKNILKHGVKLLFS